VLFREVTPEPASELAWTGMLSSVVSTADAPTSWDRHTISVDRFRRAHANLTHRRMACEPLTGLLDRHHAPRVIDYLSLDLEGSEEAALRSLDTRRYRIAVATVERPSEGAKRLLARAGLRFERGLVGSFGEQLWLNDTLLRPETRRGLR
jgi:hypothetical protein